MGEIKTKEKPQYSILKFDYNEDTRILHLEIRESQRYKTIERYQTINHVRYPIYSDWKVKEKVFTKSIKLTSDTLENLCKSDDIVIKKFARKIVSLLPNSSLYPSWYKKELLTQNVNKELRELKSIFQEYESEQLYFINKFSNLLNTYIQDENIFDKKLKKRRKVLTKLDKKLSRIKKILQSKFLSKCFFYLCSDKRMNKYLIKISIEEDNIKSIKENISSLKEQEKQQEELIKTYRSNISKKAKEIREKQNLKITEYNMKIKALTALKDVSFSDNKDFFMLKDLKNMKYEKIKGCYVIHNRENNKCYVGQSKDIYNRLKQHFKDTYPRNSIFFDDYYKSSLPDKTCLFDIKIIPCITKDELDITEKQLIEEYDSWKKGYNGTSGNN